MIIKTILVVDDREENRYYLRLLLKRHGYRVVSAINGADALEKAKKTPPDLIISDVLMPVMDGFDLCREWKKNTSLKSIPFIVFTGIYTDDEDRKLALSLGADMFIVKTEESEKILQVIKETIEKTGHPPAKHARQAADSQKKSEPIQMQQYNEVLVRKLETTIEKLERSNLELEQFMAERKRVEAALRESEEKYRLIVENSRDIIFTLNEKGEFVYLSPSTEKLLGYKPAEIIGRSFESFIFPEDLPIVRAGIKRGMDKIYSPQGIEYRVRHASGQWRWQSTVASIAFGDDGSFVSYTGLARDITENKRIEEELKKSENTLKSITAAAPVGIAFVSDGIIEWTNDHLLELTGFRREEVVGKNARIFYDGDESYNDASKKFYADIKAKGRTEIDTCWRRKDGGVLYVNLTGAALGTASNISRVLFTAVDITDRKKALTALVESEKKYRTYLNFAPDGVFTLDNTGKFTSGNMAVCRITGYSREEIVKMLLQDLVVEESGEDGFSHFDRLIKTGAARSDIWQKRKDGSKVCLAVTAVKISETEVLGFCKDITERKKTEEALKFNNIILNIQQEASEDGILVIDPKGNIISVNRRFIDMWGITPEIAASGLQDKFFEFMVGKIVNPERPPVTDAERTEELILKDGKTFNSYSAPMVSADGIYYGRVWYMRDITERKQAQLVLQKAHDELEGRVMERTAELEAANKKLKELDIAKSDFLSLVSHELRTPLTSIKAFTEILLKNPDEEKNTRLEFLEIINSENERLTRLIDDVLDLSKIEAGLAEWNMKSVHIEEILKISIDGIREIARKNNLSLESRIEEDLPTVTADSDKIIQVMMNLLGNAVKYTPEKGNITVGAKQKGNFIEVFVSDTGIGIDPEDHQAVFERFKQISHAQTGKPKGTGLGLTICKQIIEKHKGKIWVVSELDKGSAFYFTIPCELT
jgi:PAS domain S-box-containing protein